MKVLGSVATALFFFLPSLAHGEVLLSCFQDDVPNGLAVLVSSTNDLDHDFDVTIVKSASIIELHGNGTVQPGQGKVLADDPQTAIVYQLGYVTTVMGTLAGELFDGVKTATLTCKYDGPQDN